MPPLPQMPSCPPLHLPSIHSFISPVQHLCLRGLPLTHIKYYTSHGRFSALSYILYVHQFIAQFSALKLVSVCMQVRLNVFLHFVFCSLTPSFIFSQPLSINKSSGTNSLYLSKPVMGQALQYKRSSVSNLSHISQ